MSFVLSVNVNNRKALRQCCYYHDDHPILLDLGSFVRCYTSELSYEKGIFRVFCTIFSTVFGK